MGREHELDLLLDRWRLARAGQGQVVLVVGEAGIGKSRLLQTLRDRLSGERCARLRYFCSPFHQNTPFHPILDHIGRAAGLPGDDPADVKLDKLELLFGEGPADEAVALTAALLGLATENRYPPSTLGPQGRKAKLQQAWLRQLDRLAGRGPVLMVLEDAHWIDPSSREQFDLVVNHVQRLPVLMVATARPEFVSGWECHGHVVTLALDRLGLQQSAALVARIAGDQTLTGQVLEQILARADGIPLFLEELTKAVTESGILEDQVDLARPARPMPLPAIPTTLQDSLSARLDRLGSAKEVGQIAAVIGREFSHDLLSAVAPMDGATLDQAVARLDRGGTGVSARYAA